jgi:hypothetical protein
VDLLRHRDRSHFRSALSGGSSRVLESDFTNFESGIRLSWLPSTRTRIRSPKAGTPDLAQLMTSRLNCWAFVLDSRGRRCSHHRSRIATRGFGGKPWFS